MATVDDSKQLPLSITVSPWSGFLHRIKKSIREFKYSATILVLTHILFWVNVGIVGVTGWVLITHRTIVEKGVGIVFVPGESSAIPAFSEYAVQQLQILPYLWYSMIGILTISVLLSILIYSFGRYGITTFILLLTTVLLALLAKVLITPILLLGGF